MNERRKAPGKAIKGAPLPEDYLKMVGEVFSTNFDAPLQELRKSQPSARFVAQGTIYPDEICLAVSLAFEGQLAATTVRASVDYDPLASSPKVEELLAVCIDGIGSVFSELTDEEQPQRLEQLLDASASALENVPLEWAGIKIEKRSVFLIVDKSNLELDTAAEDWLAKNDPHYQENLEKEQAETEELFITGESARKKKESLH